MKNFDPTNNILALDFDGVISDSIKECLVSGFNAYANFNGQPNIEHFEELDGEWVAHARQMRNYIRNGEDFVYIAHALANGVAVDQQKDFDAFLQRHQNLREPFFDLMTNQRITYSEARPDLWAALNPLYPGMRDFVADYPHKQNLYIITTKKLIFVHKILKANSISLVEKNLRDTTGGISKQEIIKEILADRAITSDHFYFVDDQVDTLIKIKPTQVNLFFAAWGYNTPAQAELSRKHEIPVLELPEFFQRFRATEHLGF